MQLPRHADATASTTLPTVHRTTPPMVIVTSKDTALSTQRGFYMDMRFMATLWSN